VFFDFLRDRHFCFFIFSHSTFDVGRSMFDVHFFVTVNGYKIPKKSPNWALILKVLRKKPENIADICSIASGVFESDLQVRQD